MRFFSTRGLLSLGSREAVNKGLVGKGSGSREKGLTNAFRQISFKSHGLVLLSSLPDGVQKECLAQIAGDKQVLAHLYEKRKGEVQEKRRVVFPELKAVEAEIKTLHDEWKVNQPQLLLLRERLQQRFMKPDAAVFSDLLKPLLEKEYAEDYRGWLQRQEEAHIHPAFSKLFVFV